MIENEFLPKSIVTMKGVLLMLGYALVVIKAFLVVFHQNSKFRTNTTYDDMFDQQMVV